MWRLVASRVLDAIPTMLLVLTLVFVAMRLLPGDPALDERSRWMAVVAHGRPEIRITMTYPAIESSRRVAFLVAGREKASILRAIRAGDSQVPAARVRPIGEIFWFVDLAAAGEG